MGKPTPNMMQQENLLARSLFGLNETAKYLFGLYSKKKSE